jgi:hypothetical protein
VRTVHYLLMLVDDTAPELYGPFRNAGERDRRAKALRNKHGEEHGLFKLNITALGVPEVAAYSGGFFMEESKCERR